MPPVYPTLSIVAALGVVALELLVVRSDIFRQPAYWLTMVVVFGFMIPVDGWLTKLSAPIVVYRDSDTSGLRPVWDILAEEFLYAFALLTLVILAWDHAGRASDDRPAGDDRPDDHHTDPQRTVARHPAAGGASARVVGLHRRRVPDRRVPQGGRRVPLPDARPRHRAQ